MQLTPEIKAQLAEQKKQCIFCKIISGEMEGKKVFEDDKVLAVLDIYPAIKGHTIVMLKEHYPIMPYIPADEFKHYFGMIPGLSKAIKDGMVSTGINVFVANGGVAGQQSPHFLIHFFPREKGDGFFNFWLNKRKESLTTEQQNMLANNMPIMMNNHFGRNPASWHQGKGERPDFLSDKKGKVIYEDEKALCILPEKGVVKGHMEIYSKEEENVDKLSVESASHLFFVASFAATAVFEGLGVQGTNIILKSGKSDDNPDGTLSIHVLPRSQEDGLNETLLWKPEPPSYDLDSVIGKIKDKTWKISHKEKKETTSPVVVAPKMEVGKKKPLTAEEEIRKAIEKVSK